MSNQYSMKIYPAGRGREVYRNIEICGSSTLNQLCQVILESFDFIDEHLYQALLFGVMISAVIETSQLVFMCGLFDWDDMIHNGLGCMVGCLVVDGGCKE